MEEPLALRVRWGHTKSYKLVNFNQNQTVQQTIQEIVSKAGLNPNERYSLYTPSFERERWLASTSTLAQAGLQARYVIEVKFPPKPIHLCLWNPSVPLESFDFSGSHPLFLSTLTVDFFDPLNEYMDWIYGYMKNAKEEHAIQVLSKDPSQRGRWINTNVSLCEQEIEAGSWLLLSPISLLLKNVASQPPVEKEGFLAKTSIKSTKRTNVKKRWCSVRGNFFYYYASPNSNPSGVIPLEYYEVQKKANKAELTLLPMGRSLVASQGGVLPTYIFECESEKDINEWIDLIEQKCTIGAGKQVFGVSLWKVMSRKQNRHCIPAIITQAVEFLDQYGLEQQGIFRISGLNSRILKYKRDFNHGLAVHFDESSDPHVISGLLKLYLRELPEPLIPFEMYGDFLRFEVSELEDHLSEITELVGKIPNDNYRVLSYLVHFLGRVEARHEVNLMSVSNLAVVFGPNILRPQGDDAHLSMRMIQDTPAINKLMELFITNRSSIFCHDTTRPATPAPTEAAVDAPGKRVNLSLDLHSTVFQRADAPRRSGSATTGFLSARGASSPTTQPESAKYEEEFASEEDDEESTALSQSEPEATSELDATTNSSEESTDNLSEGTQESSPRRGGPTPRGGRGVRGTPPRGPTPPGRGNRRLVRGSSAKRMSSMGQSSIETGQSSTSTLKKSGKANSMVNTTGSGTPNRLRASIILTTERNSKLPSAPPPVPTLSESPPADLTVQQLFEMLQNEIAARKRLEERVAELEALQRS